VRRAIGPRRASCAACQEREVDELQKLVTERESLEKRLRDAQELEALRKERQELEQKLATLLELERTLNGPDASPEKLQPTGANNDEPQPVGFGGLLGGLPWWFPIAIGWFLAPQLFGTPSAIPDNIFSPPSEQQERQMLREERSLVSPNVQRELYGR